METKDVSLVLSKEIVTPIVKAKIEEAIINVMGGKEELINKVINAIINRKVDEQGNVNDYSSRNTHDWLESILTKQLESAVKEELQKQIVNSTSIIKECLISQLQTRKGANSVASALLAGLEATFKNSWNSKINIVIQPTNDKS